MFITPLYLGLLAALAAAPDVVPGVATRVRSGEEIRISYDAKFDYSGDPAVDRPEPLPGGGYEFSRIGKFHFRGRFSLSDKAFTFNRMLVSWNGHEHEAWQTIMPVYPREFYIWRKDGTAKVFHGVEEHPVSSVNIFEAADDGTCRMSKEAGDEVVFDALLGLRPAQSNIWLFGDELSVEDLQTPDGPRRRFKGTFNHYRHEWITDPARDDVVLEYAMYWQDSPLRRATVLEHQQVAGYWLPKQVRYEFGTPNRNNVLPASAVITVTNVSVANLGETSSLAAKPVPSGAWVYLNGKDGETRRFRQP